MKDFIRFLIIIFTAVILVVAITFFADDGALIGQFLDMEGHQKEIVSELRRGILNGEEEIQVKYIGKKKDIKKIAIEAVNTVLNEDDPLTSDDFDYLRHKYRGYSATMRGFGFYAEITYSFSYSESREQTEWVNQEVNRILGEIITDDMQDYQKIKKIHDYIIENISYDLTVKFNSAYEGLNSRVTACEGYANLAYKMFTDAGINCRVITGVANGEAHAWNIVEIDNKWYNIDCTWDDPVGGGNNNSYNYFLKSNYDFTDHIRDKEYNTSDFNLKYTMSTESWGKK